MLEEKLSDFLVSIQFTFLGYNSESMDWKEFYRELGKRLKSARKLVSFTQNEIAKEIGITRQYIIQIEKGKAKGISLNVILDYLDTCKIDYVEFFSKLEKDISKEHYEKVVSKVNLPSDYRLRKKVSRDIELYHTKIKGKTGKAKPLSQESRDKAIVKFGNYRAKIEHIQSLAYKIIAKHAPSTTLNPFYRVFVNEIYKKLKKNYLSNLSLDKGFDEIIGRWIKKGLKEEVLLEIKDVVIKYFEPEKQG